MSSTNKILAGVGGVTILLLIAAWVYLFVYGAPDSVQEITTDLGMERETTYIPPNIDDLNGNTQLALANNSAIQLTTRAMAGFSIIEDGSDTHIRYAEKGTGHIYEINMSTGADKRISGATVGQTVKAEFSGDGELVVIMSEVGDDIESSLYVLDGENATKLADFPQNSGEFSFTVNGNVRYAVKEGSKTTAYEYQPDGAETVSLWQIPLTDINLYWRGGEAIAVNKVSSNFKGGVFEISGDGVLSRLITPSYGLSAVIEESGRYILFAALDDETKAMVSYRLDRDTGEITPTSLPAIPEKCVFLPAEKFLCASSPAIEGGDRTALNRWYSGELTSPDTLWEESNEGSSAVYLDSLSEIANFDVDVTDLAATTNGKMLFFRNKLNDALWMYRFGEEITAPAEETEATATSTDASESQTPEQ